MKFFVASDFVESSKHVGGMIFAETPNAIAERANAKLIKDGKVVHTAETDMAGGKVWYQADQLPHPGPTHKALLINIEKIEKCTHPAEKVGGIYQSGGMPEFQCECGVKVVPESFKVCE